MAQKLGQCTAEGDAVEEYPRAIAGRMCIRRSRAICLWDFFFYCGCNVSKSIIPGNGVMGMFLLHLALKLSVLATEY